MRDNLKEAINTWEGKSLWGEIRTVEILKQEEENYILIIKCTVNAVFKDQLKNIHQKNFNPCKLLYTGAQANKSTESIIGDKSLGDLYCFNEYCKIIEQKILSDHSDWLMNIINE